MGCIGIVALSLNPSIQPYLALPYVILKVMPIGLKGLTLAAMIAVIMSSVDAFLNAAAIAVENDIIYPIFKNKNRLVVARFCTYIIALASIAFSLHFESSLDLLLQSYVFWTPVINRCTNGLWYFRCKEIFFYILARYPCWCSNYASATIFPVTLR